MVGHEPYCSTSVSLLETKRHVGSIGLGPDDEGFYGKKRLWSESWLSVIQVPPAGGCRTLLLLITVIFSNGRVQQTATLFIFRLDVYSRDILNDSIHTSDQPCQSRAVETNPTDAKVDKQRQEKRTKGHRRVKRESRASSRSRQVDMRYDCWRSRAAHHRHRRRLGGWGW